MRTPEELIAQSRDLFGAISGCPERVKNSVRFFLDQEEINQLVRYVDETNSTIVDVNGSGEYVAINGIKVVTQPGLFRV